MFIKLRTMYCVQQRVNQTGAICRCMTYFIPIKFHTRNNPIQITLVENRIAYTFLEPCVIWHLGQLNAVVGFFLQKL